MQETQFVFVTEDARVMARMIDGRLVDVTKASDLLPTLGTMPCEDTRFEKKSALLKTFTA
ncbi:MAG: hypothetical protein JKY27_12890 [Magnetovibrio sp.]|nr:hypothetical protein [Magnetovibrio sp.]